MGLWVGLFWTLLGFVIVISGWLGKSGLRIPSIDISPGWIIVLVGLLRIGWWWKTVEEPKRQRQELRAELEQLEEETRELQRKQENAS